MTPIDEKRQSSVMYSYRSPFTLKLACRANGELLNQEAWYSAVDEHTTIMENQITSWGPTELFTAHHRLRSYCHRSLAPLPNRSLPLQT